MMNDDKNLMRVRAESAEKALRRIQDLFEYRYLTMDKEDIRQFIFNTLHDSNHEITDCLIKKVKEGE